MRDIYEFTLFLIIATLSIIIMKLICAKQPASKERRYIVALAPPIVMVLGVHLIGIIPTTVILRVISYLNRNSIPLEIAEVLIPFALLIGGVVAGVFWSKKIIHKIIFLSSKSKAQSNATTPTLPLHNHIFISSSILTLLLCLILVENFVEANCFSLGLIVGVGIVSLLLED